MQISCDNFAASPIEAPEDKPDKAVEDVVKACHQQQPIEYPIDDKP
jgi:hypothetical protein